MISKLKIENFRSIRELEINFNKINAFIGPNNAGKSNILKALNLVLGEYFPTPNSFNDVDFFKINKKNEIKIDVTFNKKINQNVKGFLLTFSENNALKYEKKTKNSNERSNRVSKKDKEEISLIYIPVDRSLETHIKSTKWTLYGKILQKINDEIEAENKQKFKDGLQKLTDDTLKEKIQKMDNLKKYVKEYTY